MSEGKWRVELVEKILGFYSHRLHHPDGRRWVETSTDVGREIFFEVAAALNEAEALRADLDAARARVEELEAWKAQVELIVLEHIPAAGSDAS